MVMEQLRKGDLFVKDIVEECIGMEIGNFLSVDMMIILMNGYKEIIIDILLMYCLGNFYQVVI